MFVKQLQVGHMAVFAYIVGDPDTGEGLVIDPAAQVDLILSEAKKGGITKILYIVNTHNHVDHISGNAEMKQRTGAQIVIHEEDAEMLAKTPGMILKMFGAKPSPSAEKVVREGDTIEVGKVALKVLHTPGHTPGGISLYTEGYVFTGDTLFIGAVGRTDLPGGSWRAMLQAIREKLLVLPDDTVVFPGHNYGTSSSSTIGREKKTNSFLR